MISLAITTYNRSDLTVESFSKVYDHELIDEIVIIDDCSDNDKYSELVALLINFETDYIYKNGLRNKLQLFRNEQNLGMSKNKAEAISKCRNEWVILFDSDNVLYPEYLDWIHPEQMPHPECIYCPTKAEPNFDFTEFEGTLIYGKNAKDFLNNEMFRVFLNCANYLVNREKYLEVYQYDPNIKEADTIHFNTLWLQAGYSFYFVPGMVYYHRVHKDSGWLKNHRQNIEDANRLQRVIEGL